MYIHPHITYKLTISLYPHIAASWLYIHTYIHHGKRLASLLYEYDTQEQPNGEVPRPIPALPKKIPPVSIHVCA